MISVADLHKWLNRWIYVSSDLGRQVSDCPASRDTCPWKQVQVCKVTATDRKDAVEQKCSKCCDKKTKNWPKQLLNEVVVLSVTML